MHLIARLKPAVAAREVSKVVPTSTAFLLQNWGSGCNCMPNRAMILNHYLCCTSVKYHIATIMSYPLVCKWSWESVFVKTSNGSIWGDLIFSWIANQDNKEKHLWRRESSVAHLRWSELDSRGESCCCHLKLPQQVALTAFNKQVNAQVRVIGRTNSQTRNSSAINDITCLSPWTVWRKKKSKISNTTPTNSTYCFQKASLCLC